MKLECIYTFHLSQGRELLIRRPHGDSPEEWHFPTDRDDVTVTVEVPAKETGRLQGAARRVARNEREKWEVWALPDFRVCVVTDHEPARDDSEVSRPGLPRVEDRTDPIAIAAASKFLRTVRWRRQQFWLPERLTLSDATLSVEYCEAGGRVLHSKSMLEGRVPPIEKALSQHDRQTIEQDLRASREATLPEVLLLDAMLYRSLRDRRVALMLAAFSLEMALTGLLRNRIRQASVAAGKDMDLIDRVPNRFLSGVMLGLLDIGEAGFRQRCSEVFELRNQVVHRGKDAVAVEEANKAIDAASNMLGFLLQAANSTPTPSDRSS